MLSLVVLIFPYAKLSKAQFGVRKNKKHQQYKALRALKFLHRFGKARKHLKEVADHTVVCGFEERSIRVFVHHHNRFGAVHPCEVLDGSANASSDVEVRVDGDTGLPNVLVVGAPVAIRHRAATGGGGAQGVGQVRNHGPVFRPFEAPTAGDDELGLGQGSDAFGALGADHLYLGRGEGYADGFNAYGAAAFFNGDGVAHQADDLSVGQDGNIGEGFAGEYRFLSKPAKAGSDRL